LENVCFPFHIQDNESGKSIDFTIPQKVDGEQFIEIELLAAAVTVKGESVQRQKVTAPMLSYYWNCLFEKSGNHELTLILRLVDPPNPALIRRIEHSFHVVKLDHLNQRQVRLLSAVVGALATLVGIFEALHKLGVVGKIPELLAL
jgi:hypothetical protein